MPIEINGLNAHKARQATTRAGTKTGSSGDSTHAGQSVPSSADQVSLTDSVARIKAIEERLASEPVVDNQRIQSVQDAIKSGEYHVDPEKVADKIIELESALDK